METKEIQYVDEYKSSLFKVVDIVNLFSNL